MRSVVLLAWATGGLVALVLVAAAAATATVFGLGWVVFGVAAVVAGLSVQPVADESSHGRRAADTGALTLPAVAVALSPLRLHLPVGLIGRASDARIAPSTRRSTAAASARC